MRVSKKPGVYYAVFFETFYDSLEDAVSKAPDVIAAHQARSNEFHGRGTLLMAGAFLNNLGEALCTMAILTTREAAEEYAKGDPFVLNGMVSKWYIREWANMFTQPTQERNDYFYFQVPGGLVFRIASTDER